MQANSKKFFSIYSTIYLKQKAESLYVLLTKNLLRIHTVYINISKANKCAVFFFSKLFFILLKY